MGVLARQDQIQIEVDTNLGSYILPYQTYDNGTQSLSFLGFLTTTPGEYITAFILTTQYGSGSLPGVTNVEVGYQSAVPEPTSIVSGGIAILVGLGHSFATQAVLELTPDRNWARSPRAVARPGDLSTAPRI